jgi:uncharacterized protein (DUF302 family)
MHQNSSLSLLRAPCGAPFFLFFRYSLLLVGVFLGMAAGAAEDVATRQMLVADFATAREALVESIENEGLKVREIIPFNSMLERTAASLGRPGSPFVNVEIVQFCSSPISWQMLEEDASQMALCPLSIVIYMKLAEPGKATLAWRLPGQDSPGRRNAGELLRKLAERAVEIAQRRR